MEGNENGLEEKVGKGGNQKKTASGERRGFLLLKENDKYGSSPKTIFVQIQWFSP